MARGKLGVEDGGLGGRGCDDGNDTRCCSPPTLSFKCNTFLFSVPPFFFPLVFLVLCFFVSFFLFYLLISLYISFCVCVCAFVFNRFYTNEQANKHAVKHARTHARDVMSDTYNYSGDKDWGSISVSESH